MFGNKDNIASALAPLLTRIDKLESELKRIKADNKSLTDKLSAIEDELAALKASQQAPINEDHIHQDTNAAQAPNGELEHISPSPLGGGVRGGAFVFLPSPTLSGSFPSFSTEEEIGKSIYKLTTDDGIHGTFELLQTPDAIATAMISVSQFLKPVCRITGNTHRLPEKIETIEKGEAKKEDGLWTVTKKAVVKFE